MIKIPLKGGKEVVLDSEDYDKVKHLNWYAAKRNRRHYAAANVSVSPGKRTVVYMHRILVPGVPQVDHKDGDGLNNQRYNLRASDNPHNHRAFKRKRAGCYSKFRGVSFDKRRGTWKVEAQKDQRRYYLGSFRDEVEAARAYDQGIARLGGFAAEARNFSDVSV